MSTVHALKGRSSSLPTAPVGGKQTIVDDPSGNPIELFEPMVPEACLRKDDA